MKYDAIVFDFDGTLVDSITIKEKAFKEMYSKFGLDPDIRLGGKSRYEKFRYWHGMIGIKLTDDELKKIAKQYSDKIVDDVIKAPYIKGAKKFLEKYKGDLYLVSGTPQHELEYITNSRKMYYFKEIHGGYDEKYKIIKDIAQRHNYKKILLVGDDINDFDNAIKSDSDFIGIGGGTAFPDNIFTVNNFDELEQKVKE